MSNQNNSKDSFQVKAEKNIFGLVLGLSLAVSLAGIVEIVPLFTVDSVFENKVVNADGTPKYKGLVWARKAGQTIKNWKTGDGVRPLSGLELAGRDIYQREGCFLCHSQMIRPFRDEKERYGHYSLAVESMYDHPFQWGSKRTGPDLARVGGKYSDEWQTLHLRAPRSLVPESVMPNYGFLDKATIDPIKTQKHMTALRLVGVPYADGDITEAAELVKGKTEMQAMVAYLQVLGTMIKFEPGVEYRE